MVGDAEEDWARVLVQYTIRDQDTEEKLETSYAIAIRPTKEIEAEIAVIREYSKVKAEQYKPKKLRTDIKISIWEIPEIPE